MFLVKALQKLAQKFGFALVDINALPGDMIEPEFLESYYKNKKFTMTSIDRMYAMYQAMLYVIDNKIEGDIVECGVWRGGSMMLCADMLVNRKIDNIPFWMYDTYTGMSEPTDKDLHFGFQEKAFFKWKRREKSTHNTWCYAPLEDVTQNMYSTNYPKEKIKFIKGKVEDTIPGELPEKIALLHLDTDWYESTYHELEHLFPLLAKNAVLIVDDYGFWQGAREAVDQYFKEKNIKLLFNRIDYTGRLFINNI